MLLNEANTEDVNASWPASLTPSSGTTNVFYASFTVKFTSLPSGGGTYFAHFKNSSTDFSGAHLGADRRGRAGPVPAGNFLGRRLGRQRHEHHGFAPQHGLHRCDPPGEQQLGQHTLWINPTAESDPSISTSESASAFTVVSYALRENTGEGALNMDNLRVGTSFADVFSGGSGQPPAITSQSQNQTVTNGASVTFSVNATGTPPLNFQWQFNCIGWARIFRER